LPGYKKIQKTVLNRPGKIQYYRLCNNERQENELKEPYKTPGIAASTVLAPDQGAFVKPTFKYFKISFRNIRLIRFTVIIKVACSLFLNPSESLINMTAPVSKKRGKN
jgi:hypothetical protein